MNSPTLRFPEFNGEWNTTVVHDLYKIVPTNSYSRNDLNYISGTIKNIHYGDIHVKFNSHLKVCESILPFINENLNYQRYTTESYCANGDIILADASEDVKDIGKSIEILNVFSEKVLAGLHTIHLKPISKAIFEGFGGYLFRTKSVVKQIQKESQGAKVLGVSGKKILKLNLSYPPDEKEQQKIADFLQKADERIALLEQKKKLLERYKKGVMEKIFTQELRFKDDDGNEFSEWENTTLGKITKIIGGGTPDTNNPEYWNGNLQWFTPTEIKTSYVSTSLRTITSLGLKSSSARLLPKGTILLTSRATIGEVAIATQECATNQGFQSLIVGDEVNVFFLFNWLKNNKNELLKRANGSTFAEISKKEIEQIPIQLPIKKEQDLIANLLHMVDLKIDKVENQLKLAALWKKGLLQQMFV